MICVIDNLELLETVKGARDALEQLRDRLFNLPGTRWVLCGSRGIVSRVRTERLSGIFDAPIRVGPLEHSGSLLAVERRLAHFAGVAPYPPVTPGAFEVLYTALNSNLRDAMAYAQQFSQWLYSEYVIPNRELPDVGARGELLYEWLAKMADDAHADARGVQRRHWQ